MSFPSAVPALRAELDRIEQLPVDERAAAYSLLHARFAEALERAGDLAGSTQLFHEEELFGEAEEPDRDA